MTKARCLSLFLLIASFSHHLAARTFEGRVFIQGNSCAVPASGFNLVFDPEKVKHQQSATTVTLDDGTFQIDVNPGFYYVSIYQGGIKVFGNTALVKDSEILRFTLSPAEPAALSCPANSMSDCPELQRALHDPEFASFGGPNMKNNTEIQVNFNLPGFSSCSIRKFKPPILPADLTMRCSAPKGKLLDLETSIKSCNVGSREFDSGFVDKSGARTVTFNIGEVRLSETARDGGVILEFHPYGKYTKEKHPTKQP